MVSDLESVICKCNYKITIWCSVCCTSWSKGLCIIGNSRIKELISIGMCTNSNGFIPHYLDSNISCLHKRINRLLLFTLNVSASNIKLTSIYCEIITTILKIVSSCFKNINNIILTVLRIACRSYKCWESSIHSSICNICNKCFVIKNQICSVKESIFIRLWSRLINLKIQEKISTSFSSCTNSKSRDTNNFHILIIWFRNNQSRIDISLTSRCNREC